MFKIFVNVKPITEHYAKQYTLVAKYPSDIAKMVDGVVNGAYLDDSTIIAIDITQFKADKGV